MQEVEVGRAVLDLVAAWLAWHDELDRRERTAELEDRVEGYRIVDGGQESPDGSWSITDAETGELLARGVGLDSLDASWQDSWVHKDAIGREAHDATKEPDGRFGLPEGMAKALVDWVVDRPAEARLVLGR